MLPKTNNISGFQIREQASRTFLLDIEKNTFVGDVDGLEAIKQSIYCILNTERYDYIIYSWNYGIELKELIGRPFSYVKSELKRKITEALTQDDRILGVDAFSFESKKRCVLIAFTVHTKLGDIIAEKEVDI